MDSNVEVAPLNHPEVWDQRNGNLMHHDQKNFSVEMPDLIRLDPSLEGTRNTSPDIPQKERRDSVVVNGTSSPAPPEDNSMDTKSVMQNGVSSAEAKKKIPVDSLSKEELVQQVKKQMILLQKLKARNDELQHKQNALEKQCSYASDSAPENDAFQPKLVALENELKQERESHRRTKEQAARSQHSVAELELRDYQRTISQLNEKLHIKEEVITRSAEQLSALEQLVITKDAVIHDKSMEVEEFTGKCARLEDDLTDSRRQCVDSEKVITKLRDDISHLRDQVRSLETTICDNTSQQSDLVRNFSILQETVSSQNRTIQQKSAEITRLHIDLTHSRSQHEHIMRDFEEYKMRAQAMLRQQKDSADCAQQQREIEDLSGKVTELENELSSVKQLSVTLEEELQQKRRVEDSIKRSFDQERLRCEKTLLESEERIRNLEVAQESAYQDQRRQIKLYELEIANLKDLHGTTSTKLLQELQSLRSQNEALKQKLHAPPEADQNHSHSDDDSPCIRSKSEETFERRSEGASSDDVSELQQTFSRTISQSASEIVHIPPLERLLSSHSNSDVSISDADARKMKHLSELLHESESSNVKLNEQIKLLKQEFRRLEANVEREKHADSMEYLKNVLIKFLTRKVSVTEQEKLVEVMTTILKLTLDERQQLMKAASASYIPENIKVWGNYLNPWKAKDG